MFEEQEVIAGCRKGDRKMQKRLYDQYCSQMLVVCFRYSKLKSEAEDIMQESFIKVFDHIKDFRGESPLKFWIKRIMINTALNYHRSKLFLYPMVDVTEMKEKDHQEVEATDFHFKDLLQMIQSLPMGCQVIFNLYAIEGYKHDEIAKMLEISPGTSKSQYARARKILQGKLIESEKMDYGKLS